MKARVVGIVFAATLSCATVCSAQFNHPTPPLVGGQPSVNPADPTNHAGDIPPVDPAAEREMLKQRRIHAYRKMHADSRMLAQLAAELNAELNPPPDQPASTDPRKTAQDALNHARKIEKLAGEIDKLMRED